MPGTAAPAAPEKQKFKMPSLAELYMYYVALFCGISSMMPVNSVFSAPSYIMNYYKYTTKGKVLEPSNTNFWNNVLSYYTIVSLVIALICEPATLTPLFRRVPVLLRLYAGLLILIAEIILLIVVPAVGCGEDGAIATLLVAALVGGFGKAMFESTVYGMLSTFHPSFTSVMMGGIGISGVLTSFIQIIVKAAVEDSYDGVVMQSHIYYGLDIGIQAVTFISLVLMRFNSYAREQFGDLGGKTEKMHRVRDMETTEEENSPTGTTGEPADHRSVQGVSDGAVVPESTGDTGLEAAEQKLAARSPSESALEPTVVQGVPCHGEEALTSNELLRKTPLWPVLKLIYWMCIACGFNFGLTLMLFPTVSISAYVDDYWYPTLAIFIFNVVDVIGRFAPAFKITWPTYGQRWIIVAASFARVIFLPLLLLYSYHYIKGHAFGYVMMVIFGLSNGYIGTMSTVLGPKTKGIDNDGKRFVAGTMMVVSVLFGGAIGTGLGIMMQTVRAS